MVEPVRFHWLPLLCCNKIARMKPLCEEASRTDTYLNVHDACVFYGVFLALICMSSVLVVCEAPRALAQGKTWFVSTEGLLSPNIPPSNGPLHRPQVTSSYNCFASECSVVLQAAKGLSKEDIQLLLTAKEADKVTRSWRAFMLPWVHVCL